MESEDGLSLRVRETLHKVVPGLNAASPSEQRNAVTAIDLSSAENEVLRPELLEFFKSTVEDLLRAPTYIQQIFTLPGPSLDGAQLPLRVSLASFFNNYMKPIHAVKPEHIVVTAGASDALESVVHAVCDDGDSVLTPGPYWNGLEHVFTLRAKVKIILAQPPTYENYDNYLVPSLQAAYDFSPDKSRIKAVLVCNPHNPTSRCYRKDALLELMEFCQERGLHLISDEVYALTDLHGVSNKAPKFVSALSLTEPLVPEGAVKVDPSRVHVVWSASKLFGISGFRVFLRSRGIDFVTPTHGLFLFAKLAKGIKTAQEEKNFFDLLALQGVLVGHGRFYKGVEGDFGWARIRFSVSVDIMNAALERIAMFLSRNA
ncbi:PLP-dependent transferase [Pyrenochaeta sp. DS3sAY3a]|nr:PLP-dependent transferase [Pyrenochaeta sp. DS3sAY3a]